jgi:nitroreductase
VKSLIKRAIPEKWRPVLFEFFSNPFDKISNLFAYSKLLSSLYYFLLSREFGGEHRAVLAGKKKYRSNLSITKANIPLIRRNIHRLEKGLVMQPRRSIFAQGYIEETVKALAAYNTVGDMDPDERAWFVDVLDEYFNSVEHSVPAIIAARNMFDQLCVSDTPANSKPYKYGEMGDQSVSFSEIEKLFLRRRSVRWFTNAPVPDSDLFKAVDIAKLAPSACNRLPYRMLDCNGSNRVKQIASCAAGTAGWVDNIPAIVVLVGDLSAYPKERDRHLIYIDGSLAAMQFMLALETLGLSSCPINWPDIRRADKNLAQYVELAPYERTIMLIAVGYADKNGGIPYSYKKQTNSILSKV